MGEATDPLSRVLPPHSAVASLSGFYSSLAWMGADHFHVVRLERAHRFLYRLRCELKHALETARSIEHQETG